MSKKVQKIFLLGFMLFAFFPLKIYGDEVEVIYLPDAEVTSDPSDKIQLPDKQTLLTKNNKSSWSGSLPKTNTDTQQWLILCGIFLVCESILLFKLRTKKNEEAKE